MKNIFILDCSDDEIFRDFIDSDFFKVIGCIVYTQQQKEFCLQNHVNIVHTLEEMDFLMDLESFDFGLIDNFRSTQRKIEFGMMRSLNSNMLIANKYYNALCFFKRIFDTFNIDCIFVNGLPHGYIPETILLDFGKKNHIPTYFVFPITASYSSIIKYNDGKCLQVANHISQSEITQHLFDKNKNSYSLKIINSRLGGSLQKIAHRCGGQLLVDFLSCIKRLSLRIRMGFYNIRFIEKLYSFYRLQEMKVFYKKHSVTPDYNKNYVFFALHFEPEAATGVVCELQNQLTIIQLLSKALPKDWLLYIKDHPHQYNINNTLDHYYLTNIQFFKDQEFYKDVLKLPNVRLIKLETESSDLIKHAKAVATINGSIILESVIEKKHCITFDNYLMPITQTKLFKNIFTFTNLDSLKHFFDFENLQASITNLEIDNGLRELSRYYFDHHKATNAIIQTIEEDLKK